MPLKNIALLEYIIDSSIVLPALIGTFRFRYLENIYRILVVLTWFYSVETIFFYFKCSPVYNNFLNYAVYLIELLILFSLYFRAKGRSAPIMTMFLIAGISLAMMII